MRFSARVCLLLLACSAPICSAITINPNPPVFMPVQASADSGKLLIDSKENDGTTVTLVLATA